MVVQSSILNCLELIGLFYLLKVIVTRLSKPTEINRLKLDVSSNSKFQSSKTSNFITNTTTLNQSKQRDLNNTFYRNFISGKFTKQFPFSISKKARTNLSRGVLGAVPKSICAKLLRHRGTVNSLNVDPLFMNYEISLKPICEPSLKVRFWKY